MTYNTVVGDHILISHFVRYERLAELINTEFYNSGHEEINVFIDAYSMIKSVYKLEPSQFIDKFSIASCIINACAHYRNFFWTRYRVTCKIWIVFSRMEQSIKEARMFYAGYGNIFSMESNPSMDKMIEDNMNILNSLCPYIPDVQFIYSKYEPGLVFGKIAMVVGAKASKIKPSFIISKDIWNLQVVGNVNNVYMIRPIKKNGEDLSLLISYKNLIDYYIKLRKMSITKDTCNYNIINGSFISFIMAASTFPERNMKSLHNLSTIIKYIIKYMRNLSDIRDINIYDITNLCKDLNNENRNAKLNEFEINLRYEATGFNPCIFRYMMSPLIDNTDIINLHDPDSVKRLNETVFAKVPLDLMSL